MKVQEDVKRLAFSEDDSELSVTYGNRGEPFRDGVEFMFDRRDGRTCPIWVLLEAEEVALLRDKLNEFLDPDKPKEGVRLQLRKAKNERTSG